MLSSILLIVTTLVSFTRGIVCDALTSSLPHTTTSRDMCRICQNGSDIVIPSNLCVYCSGLCIEAALVLSFGVPCINRKRVNCADYEPVTVTQISPDTSIPTTTSKDVTVTNTQNFVSVSTETEAAMSSSSSSTVVSSKSTLSTNGSSPTQSICTKLGNKCGPDDSRIESLAADMYLCVNQVCYCNFNYLNSRISSICGVPPHYTYILRASVPAFFDQKGINSDCRTLSVYRQCVANILGECESYTKMLQSNQADGCTFKWLDKICNCRGVGILCFGGDNSGCGKNSNTNSTFLEKYCPGGCAEIAVVGGASHIGVQLAPFIVLLLIGTLLKH
jgi:hypothetical protein